MKEFTEFIGHLLLGMIVGFALVFITCTPLRWHVCNSYGEYTGLETKYDVSSFSCYVKYNDKWYNKQEMRGIRE